MMVDGSILGRLYAAFPRAILNTHGDFVADPRSAVNSWFILADCETEEAVTAKLLEWLSRDAFKSLHFNSLAANRRVWEYHRNGINAFCHTNFSAEDMEEIYTYLGNCCNHGKTLAFIRSGYDMTILSRKENFNECT